VQDAIQEKLTIYTASTECFKVVVAGLGPCGYLLWLAVKNKSISRLTKYFVLTLHFCYNK